jgi:hypothetical protein
MQRTPTVSSSTVSLIDCSLEKATSGTLDCFVVRCRRNELVSALCADGDVLTNGKKNEYEKKKEQHTLTSRTSREENVDALPCL